METGEEIRDYILEVKLGEGATGEVWKARHKQLRRTVAIKIIDENVSANAGLKKRIQREADTMEAVSHPNIVELLEYFLLGERQPILVMRFIEGGSLQDQIDNSPDGKVDIDQALRISKDILGALDTAHRKGLIHRDVKPANILLDKSGKAYLTDFGIAHVLGKDKLTMTGSMIGTPEYMSPEQIRGEKVTHLADVYSYGCVLYEMLTGEPPFGSRDKGSTDYEIMSRHDKGEYVPIGQKNPSVDQRVADVISEALALEPSRRPGGCAEMSRRLFAPEIVIEEEVPSNNAIPSTVKTSINLKIAELFSKHRIAIRMSLAVIVVIVALIVGWRYIFQEEKILKKRVLVNNEGVIGRARVNAFFANNPELKSNPDSKPRKILKVASVWERKGDCEAANILYNLAAGKSADIAEVNAKRFHPETHKADGCVPKPDEETAEYWFGLAERLREQE